MSIWDKSEYVAETRDRCQIWAPSPKTGLVMEDGDLAEQNKTTLFKKEM